MRKHVCIALTLRTNASPVRILGSTDPAKQQAMDTPTNFRGLLHSCRTSLPVLLEAVDMANR